MNNKSQNLSGELGTNDLEKRRELLDKDWNTRRGIVEVIHNDSEQ